MANPLGYFGEDYSIYIPDITHSQAAKVISVAVENLKGVEFVDFPEELKVGNGQMRTDLNSVALIQWASQFLEEQQ